jgi:hypothetical protein
MNSGKSRGVCQISDTQGRLNVEYINFQVNLDIGGALGRAVVVIIAAIAELERSLMVRGFAAACHAVRQARRARIGCQPLDLDRSAVVRDRRSGRAWARLLTLIKP